MKKNGINWNSLVVAAIVVSLSTVALAKPPSGGTTTGAAPFVYTTNGDGQQILKIDTASGAVTLVYHEDGTYFEGLVFGLDDYLYACAPTPGKIIRFDPAVTPVAVETLWDTNSAPDDPAAFQCGEFTHSGDLLVTAKDVNATAAVWKFTNQPPFAVPLNLNSTPVPVNGTSSANASFEGITQDEDGDLYYVDRSHQEMRVLPMTDATGTFYPPSSAVPLSPALVDPIGSTFTSRNDLFVATDGALLGFRQNGSTWTNICNLTFRNERLFFLDAAAREADLTTFPGYKDVLFVGSAANSTAKLTEVAVAGDGSCAVANTITFKKPATASPQAVGVAVPPGTRDGKLVIQDLTHPEDQLFNFFDHAYGLNPVQGCTVSVTATEVPPTEICQRIHRIEDSQSTMDPQDPCSGTLLDPVLYLGKDYAELYKVTPSGTCTPGENGINHVVSAYTTKLRTPQIGFCSKSAETCSFFGRPVDASGECCGVSPLNLYFPEDGQIPDDGSFGGFTPAFSEFFLVDDQYEPVIQDFVECLCPIEQLSSDPALAPAYGAGSTVPLRVQVLQFPSGTDVSGICGNAANLAQACQSGSAGDYVTSNMNILLSLGLDNVPGDGIVDPVVVHAGGNDSEQPPYLSPPNSINASSWTYQLKAPIVPGLYKAVLFFINRKIEYPAEIAANGDYVNRYLRVQ